MTEFDSSRRGSNDDGEEATSDATDVTADDTGSREVFVPLRLYKTVTVFSTLIAVGAILAGFIVLDRATQRASVAPGDADLLLVLVGLALLAGGAGVYAFSTRFQVEGMGKPKDDTAEETNNG